MSRKWGERPGRRTLRTVAVKKQKEENQKKPKEENQKEENLLKNVNLILILFKLNNK